VARANQRRQILTQKPALAKAGVMNELKTRGANDVLIAVVDGLKGDRHGLRADGGADLHHSFDPQFAGLRVVERSQDLHARSEGDLPGGDRRGRRPARYVRGEMGEAIPAIGQAWRRAWEHVVPLFAFPPAIRKMIYTTNAVESLNRSLRKIIKTRGSFPTRPR